LLQERLPAKILSALRLAGLLAEELDARVYCVGGFVRDLFLRLPNFDVDLVVEGDGVVLAENLANKLGGKSRIHDRFKTAVVTLPDGFKIDVATARTEYYEFPAALPCVEKASIKEDLYRRDFTINTLALELNPDRFGELIDFFGGRKDLENGKIRILYNFSFVEDPTRILRAIRFEQRYKFNIEEDTLRFARDAIERRLLNRLSPQRIMHELMLILEENDPVPALLRMKEIGVWDYIFPGVNLEAEDWMQLRRIPVLYAWWNERYQFSNIKSWLIYIMLLVSKNSMEKALQAVHRYFPAREIMKAVEESFAAPGLAEYFCSIDKAELIPSMINEKIGNWSNESLLYLLLCIKDETVWQKIVDYLDIKAETKLEVSGDDLKQMGLKPGPVYSYLLSQLFKMKLDGQVKNKNEELAMLRKLIEEDKAINEFHN
jgi:tRNA nucleotidyltransferase (CCA-adding enzyme)